MGRDTWFPTGSNPRVVQDLTGLDPWWVSRSAQWKFELSFSGKVVVCLLSPVLGKTAGYRQELHYLGQRMKKTKS